MSVTQLTRAGKMSWVWWTWQKSLKNREFGYTNLSPFLIWVFLTRLDKAQNR